MKEEVLDDISKELNKGNPKAPYKELKTDGKSKIECNNEYNEYGLNSILMGISPNERNNRKGR